ncbi:uncharacterized protein AMSG_02190 [Thecamonas trahens ATCC 50062]|uniref:JmjC domain-containing protein n=1 Tax=Thecamonas trahens ATCC 50062 TaxID=461836 RepID=A0A0L0DVD4_THETB|nr:hypothetical protein AMSG_02190 [Thecamonas trahens ATCC 50062]KNC56175.1 hypothetical protein AMSG_02190 [Thecamonas trahens ATCC 50062]|eukprot:XP_013761211.1 hypothetical protein AMSG_02190 [Thecamonas trahens ATCC 50062]
MERSSKHTIVHFLLRGMHARRVYDDGDALEMLAAVLCSPEYIAHDDACPLVTAVHLRIMEALPIFHRCVSHSWLGECVGMADARGWTALHVAASSKSAAHAAMVARAEPSGEYTMYTRSQLDSLVTTTELEAVVRYVAASSLAPRARVTGDTPLHIALDAERYDAARVLLARAKDDSGGVEAQARLLCGELNSVGLSALELGVRRAAASAGSTTLAARAALAAELGIGCPLIDLGDSDVWADNAGWLKEGPMAMASARRRIPSWRLGWYAKSAMDAVMARHGSDRCDVAEFDVIADAQLLGDNEAFRALVLARRMPFVVRGLVAESWADAQMESAFSRNTLLATFGRERIEVADMPYGGGYGRNVRKTTLKRYVAEVMDDGGSSQEYVFLGAPSHRRPAMLAAARLERPQLFRDFDVVLEQFALGPAGSGAQPHYHGAAMNGLIAGAKRWYFSSSGGFYNGPMAAWLEDEGQVWRTTCMQFPGDVVFVPSLWGHAVVNVLPSVAVAIEMLV